LFGTRLPETPSASKLCARQMESERTSPKVAGEEALWIIAGSLEWPVVRYMKLFTGCDGHMSGDFYRKQRYES